MLTCGGPGRSDRSLGCIRPCVEGFGDRLCRRGPIAGLVGELDRAIRVEPVRLPAQRQRALGPVCSAVAAR